MVIRLVALDARGDTSGVPALTNMAVPGREQLAHGEVKAVRSIASMLVELEDLWRGRITRIDTATVCPVVVGQGTRLFPATGPDAALDLVESRTTPKGVSIQVYRPTGRPQYETAATEPRP